MEYIAFAAVMFLLFMAMFLSEVYHEKQREKKMIRELYTEYGKIKEKKIPPERYERIGTYFEKHSGEGDFIDDITWNDLGMDELYKRMNYTHSATGEEYLYYALHDMNKSEEELAHMEELVDFFMEHADERVSVTLLMKKLGYTGKYSMYDYLGNLDYLGERNNKKSLIWNLLYIPFLCLLPFQVGIGVLGIAVIMIHNICTYMAEKKKIEPYVISFVYILHLLQVCGDIVKLPIKVCEREWKLIKENEKKLHSLKTGAFLVLWSSRSSGNPLDIVMDYIKMIFHVDLLQFNKMYNAVKAHTEEIDNLISVLGYVESTLCIGEFRASLEDGYCIPAKSDKKGFRMVDGYHPLIKNPVKNSIRTSQGVLLTGSNASGKSTFLKMVAINAILAKTIHTCAATEYESSGYYVMSSMALRDDLNSGESYYVVEIKALNRVLKRIARGGENVLCFVDEVLRGTNTIERIAASAQILNSLAGSEHICFAATHDIELAHLLKDSYRNYHFEEEIRDGDIYFPYQLMEGKATTRNAIRLLGLMGYDKEIIGSAEKMAENFEKTGNWRL